MLIAMLMVQRVRHVERRIRILMVVISVVHIAIKTPQNLVRNWRAVNQPTAHHTPVARVRLAHAVIATITARRMVRVHQITVHNLLHLYHARPITMHLVQHVLHAQRHTHTVMPAPHLMVHAIPPKRILVHRLRVLNRPTVRRMRVAHVRLERATGAIIKRPLIQRVHRTTVRNLYQRLVVIPVIISLVLRVRRVRISPPTVRIPAPRHRTVAHGPATVVITRRRITSVASSVVRV